MKVALFDQINETHVAGSLATALQALGHEVVATGRVWRGHRAPAATQDVQGVDLALERVLASGCDALLNFRASALDVRRVKRLKDKGVLTAVWLPDDPVLYNLAYRDVVDAYDIVLHCGPGNVLAFYASRGHRAGVNFPFWIDPQQWPYSWNPGLVRRGLVFLGNLHGPAKRARYELLAKAAADVSVYGKCPADPAGIHRGELHGIGALQSVLPMFRAGLNIPQTFSDYAGTAYDFPGLAGLGSFFLPSRVIQYAALGVPVITLGADSTNAHFAPMLHARDAVEASGIAGRLKRDPAEAVEISRGARELVVQHFSAMSRAHLLAALFGGTLRPRSLPPGDREHLYRTFQGSTSHGA